MSNPSAEERASPSRGESIMRKAFIRNRLITSAIAWYKAGCPEAQEDGEGPHGELEDAIHEYIDHEQQVQERMEARKQRPGELARYKKALQTANGFLVMNNLEPVKLEYGEVE